MFSVDQKVFHQKYGICKVKKTGRFMSVVITENDEEAKVFNSTLISYIEKLNENQTLFSIDEKKEENLVYSAS